ncbi:MAG TPA: hypothetical protein VF680_17185 [Allosphingosinicella sp.]|jgi:hypothetical protein
MCGIFGHVTKNVNSLSVGEMNILGLFNIERGKSSCGLTYDGEIYLGLDKDKLYSDFIKKRHIKPKSVPTIFGHTRQSSVGAINAFNAHPFGFGALDNGNYEFIGCHNGTLKNYEELAKMYNIDIEEEYFSNNIKYVRKKIDSEILLEIMYKEKNYTVLSKYIGGAALAWTWLEEPNKIYLFSGASKDWDTSINMTIERPLCVYQRSKNSTFFSSMIESLYALGADETQAFQIDNNTVYCITDGDFKNATKLLVSRRNTWQNVPYVSKNVSYTSPINVNNIRHNTVTYGTKTSDISEVYPSRRTSGMSSTVNIHTEDLFIPLPLRQGKPYYNQGRYKRNGHVITGVYVYIPGYGFHSMGQTRDEALKDIKSYTGVPFINGEFHRNRTVEPATDFIPFKLHQVPMLCYFIQGVMLRTVYDYNVMKQRLATLDKNQKYLNHIDLSIVAKHPVPPMTMEPMTDQKVYFDGKLYTGNICPLGSERVYEFSKGNLVNMRTRVDIQLDVKNPVKDVIQLPISMSKKEDVKDVAIVPFKKDVLEGVEKSLFAHEEAQTAAIMEQSDAIFMKKVEEDQEDFKDDYTGDDLEMKGKEEDEIVSNLINEELTEPIVSLNQTKKNLEGYLPNSIAKEFIKTIDNINGILSTFIVSNEKENE